MARRNIYLSDDLDRRAREARLNVSDVCQVAIGRALNGQACEDERQADNQLGRRLDWFEQRIGDIQGQVAEAGRDLKRFVLEAVAFFGVCVLLAFGLGYYLHRLSTA